MQIFGLKNVKKIIKPSTTREDVPISLIMRLEDGVMMRSSLGFHFITYKNIHTSHQEQEEQHDQHVVHYAHERKRVREAESSGRRAPVEEEIRIVDTGAERPVLHISDRSKAKVIERRDNDIPGITAAEREPTAADEEVHHRHGRHHHMRQHVGEVEGLLTHQRREHEAIDQTGERNGHGHHQLQHAHPTGKRLTVQ